jgi:hypothetical protein
MRKALILSFIIIAGVLSHESYPKGALRSDPRNEDLILIQGDALESALGWPIGSLRVGAIRDGKAVIIPSQIDERNPEGRWVYTGGPEASYDADEGLLDANDELVFMAADCGAEGDAWGLWPDAEAIDLITIIDPITEDKRYAYLLRYADALSAPPIAGSVDYVRFDPKSDTIEGVRYIAGFPETPKVSYSTYIIKKEAGGSGEDLLDRSKMRLRFSALWGAIRITIDESDMMSRLTGWIDGPVRVMRKAKHSVKLFLGLGTPEVVGETSFFATNFQFFSRLEIPFELGYVLTEASIVIASDFNKNAVGMTFWSEANREGVPVDGAWSEAEGKLDFGPSNWALLSGPQGAWMIRVAYVSDIPFTKNLYYKDDAKGDYKPDDEPGAIGATGYNLGNIHRIPKGVYEFIIHIYAPLGYRPGDEVKYLRMVDTPLLSSVASIPSPIVQR